MRSQEKIQKMESRIRDKLRENQSLKKYETKYQYFYFLLEKHSTRRTHMSVITRRRFAVLVLLIAGLKNMVILSFLIFFSNRLSDMAISHTVTKPFWNKLPLAQPISRFECWKIHSKWYSTSIFCASPSTYKHNFRRCFFIWRCPSSCYAHMVHGFNLSTRNWTFEGFFLD